MRRRRLLAAAAPGLLALGLLATASGPAGASGTAGAARVDRQWAIATVVDQAGAAVGVVLLTAVEGGTRVQVEVGGLPAGFHGFHLHAAGLCEGDFTSAGPHHDPGGAGHRDHAGDLPPVLADASGRGRLDTTTDRFSVGDAVGRAFIVHANPDNLANVPDRYVSSASGKPGPDATTLEAGDAGRRLQCGVVAIGRGPVPRGVLGSRLVARAGAGSSFPGQVRYLPVLSGALRRPDAVGEVVDLDGDVVGSVQLGRLRDGRTRVSVDVRGLPAGFHGFHVHQNGVCEGDFTSAGPHLNPTGDGHRDHAGDLPSLLVGASGEGRLDVSTGRFTVADAVGRAVIVHARPDNLANIPGRYVSSVSGQPGPDATTLEGGDADPRLQCGVVVAAR